MLDENLPTYFLKPSTDCVKHHQAFFFTRYGSEPEPTYSLFHLDPASPEAKNRFAAALFDAYNSDILFAEVLVEPEWTLPTLSQEDIRKNGGVAPPPQPIIPNDFTIQLYNPDQQVRITQKTGFWTGSSCYEFSMPQMSFRMPSVSALDRSLSDPLADATIPKMNFVWRRESKLSKDLTCFLTGKSNDATSKKKHKEPDIAVAIFSALREITIYESNMHRVEMEDYKGLEMVLLLSASVLRDMYFGNSKEVFHLAASGRTNSGGILGLKSTPPPPRISAPTQSLPSKIQIPVPAQPRLNVLATQPRRQSHPPPQWHVTRAPAQTPREAWQANAETARSRAEHETVDQENLRQEEKRRRVQQKNDQAEAKMVKRMVESEAKESRRRQTEVDRETERLRKIYGTQQQQHHQIRPLQRTPVQQRYSAPLLQGPFSAQRPSQNLQQIQNRPQPQPQLQLHPQPQPQSMRPPVVGSGPYLHTGNRPLVSQSSFFGGGFLRPDDGKRLKGGKKSLFGLRSKSEESASKLVKKKSSMF